MDTFKVGDVIRQRHQTNAPPRLVVQLTDDPAVVVVWDPDDHDYRRVFSSGHDLVSSASMVTTSEALDHVMSEAFMRTTSKAQW